MTPTPQAWVQAAPQWAGPPPPKDNTRGLLIAVIAMGSVLVLLGAVLAVVLIRRDSSNPTTQVGERFTTQTAAEASTTASSTASSTTRPTTSTTTPTTSAPPPTVPPTPPPTLPPTVVPSGNPAWFRSPSGNIGCMLATDAARCDIQKKSWPSPPSPAACNLDYGSALEVSAGGGEFLCHGDTVLGAPEVLQYGQSSRAGAFVCESASTGMTCRNDATGHGFFLAIESYRLF